MPNSPGPLDAEPALGDTVWMDCVVKGCRRRGTDNYGGRLYCPNHYELRLRTAPPRTYPVLRPPK